jgi:hypothetical protein
VVDFSSEENLRGDHGVVIREEELTIEEATFIGGVTWASDLNKEVTRVGLAGLCIDTDN